MCVYYNMEIVKLNIPDSERWTDDYLFQFCMANSDLNIERDDLGTIYIMSPVGGLSSIFSGSLLIDCTYFCLPGSGIASYTSKAEPNSLIRL